MSDLPSGFRQPLTERAVYFLGYRAVGPILRKIRSKPVPRIGGVAIFLSATALIIGVLFLDNSIREAFHGIQTQAVTLPASGTFIFPAGLSAERDKAD